MKRQLLFIFLAGFALNGFSQTTYYWVGASGGAWTDAANWNQSPDGAGSVRTTPSETDILVFDGTQLTTSERVVTGMPRQKIGSLQIVNGAKVTFNTPAAPTLVTDQLSAVEYGGSTLSVTGTSGQFTDLQPGDVITSSATIVNPMPQAQVLAIQDGKHMTISKENTSAFLAGLSAYYLVPTIYTTELIVDANSYLQFGGTSGSFINFIVNTKGGIINGNVVFNNRAGHSRLICTTKNEGSETLGLHFKQGSSLTINGSNSGKWNYHLGASLGEYLNGVFNFNDGQGSNNMIPGYDGNAGIVFEEGSTFSMPQNGEHYTPFGPSVNSNGTDLVFTPAVKFNSGSKFVHNSTKLSLPQFFSGANASYPDLEFTVGYPSNLTLRKVGNLTISGSTPAVTANTGTILVSGNISNATSNSINFGNVIMGGSTDQIIGGAGPVVFNDLIIADKASVTLASNIGASNVNLLGALNFGSNTITGTGNFYAFGTFSTNASTTFTQGSSAVQGIDDTGAGTLSYPYPVGASVTNATYLPAGTLYRSFSGSGSGLLSNYALSTTGTEVPATFTNSGYTYTTSGASLEALTPGFTRLLDINGQTLPLNLLEFEAVLAGSSVKLNWLTADEVGTKEFIIQRMDINDFYDCGTVKASNTSGNHTYNFTDNTPLNGDNYYRLKMVDIDGTFALSKVQYVKFRQLGLNQSVKYYPNPTSSFITIDHPVAVSSARVTVFDLGGRAVMSAKVNTSSSKTILDLSMLPAGIYLAEYNDGIQKLKFKISKR